MLFPFFELLLSFIFVVHVCGLDTYYTIFPKKNDDTTNNERITEDLYQRIDKATIHHSQSEYLGTMYWYAPLNADNLAHFRGDDAVSNNGTL